MLTIPEKFLYYKHAGPEKLKGSCYPLEANRRVRVERGVERNPTVAQLIVPVNQQAKVSKGVEKTLSVEAAQRVKAGREAGAFQIEGHSVVVDRVTGPEGKVKEVGQGVDLPNVQRGGNGVPVAAVHPVVADEAGHVREEDHVGGEGVQVANDGESDKILVWYGRWSSKAWPVL